MINNFEQIKNLLTFPFDDSFYFVEVIQRRKENPEMVKHALTLADYYISSLESFERKFEDIKRMCDAFNARAYIRLNYRRYSVVALDVNLKIAQLLRNGNPKAVMSAYSSAVGENHSDTDKKWLLDLDGDEISNAGRVCREITELNPNGLVALVTTQNGLHIITRKFDTMKFKTACPYFSLDDIKRDANTILYQA